MAGDSLPTSSRKPSEARLLEALTALKLDLESNKAGNIDESLLSDLVSQLESDDHSICSSLDSKVYCTLILTVLQINASQKSERVFYLLGVNAFFYGSSNTTNLKRRRHCTMTVFPQPRNIVLRRKRMPLGRIILVCSLNSSWMDPTAVE